MIPSFIIASSLLLGTIPAAPVLNETVEISQEDSQVKKVAEIEVRLAHVLAEEEKASIEYAVAAEEALYLREMLREAEKKTESSKKDADIAEDIYEDSMKEVGRLSVSLYRDGGSRLESISPYLTSDGLQKIEGESKIYESAMNITDRKIDELSARKHVSNVLRESAERSEEQERELYQEALAKEQEAQQLADAAMESRVQAEREKEELLRELAEYKETTLKEERENLDRRGEERNERERDAAVEEMERVEEREEDVVDSVEAPSSTRPTAPPSSPAPQRPTTPAPSQPITPTNPTKPERPSKPSKPVSPPKPSSNAQAIIKFAKSKIGKPYLWGGSGPDAYDCSGLVHAAYRSIGIYVPHQSGLQYNTIPKVPFSQRAPGDLIYWESDGVVYHVAIYLGNDRIIHASKPGTPLGESPLYGWNQITPYVGRL